MTKRRTIVVGAGGYIGSRVLHALLLAGVKDVVGIDPLIYRQRLPSAVLGNIVQRPIQLLEPRETDHVIWLPSPHKWGWDVRTMSDRASDVHNELMVALPSKWARTVRRFVYVSSAHVLAGGVHCAYSHYKRMGEQKMLDIAHYRGTEAAVQVVRPGTVVGDLHQALPNRVCTVPNRWANTGQLPDENYRGLYCHMNHVRDTVIRAAMCDDYTVGIKNAWGPQFLDRERLASLDRRDFFRTVVFRADEDKDVSRAKFEEYYNI